MAEHPRHREPSHVEQQAGRETSSSHRPYEVHEEHRSPDTAGSTQSSAAGGYREPSHYTEPRHDYAERTSQPREEVGGLRGIGRRISWGAIIAGVVVALAIQLLLSMLGIGIGAAVLDPTAPGDPTAWTIGAGVWWVITGLIALFVGGWVAGHLATNPDRRDGALHGVVTWSLATLIGVWMLTSTLGAVTAGAWQVVATGVQATDGLQQLQMPAGADQPQQVGPQQQQTQQQQQQEMIDPQQQQELQQQTQQVAQQADDPLAHAGIWTFVAMVLGAAAAGFGGYLATPSNAPGEASRREAYRR